MAGDAVACSAVRAIAAPGPAPGQSARSISAARPCASAEPLGAVAHPLGDLGSEVGDARAAPDADERAAVGPGRAARGWRRLDPGLEPAAAARVEAGRGHRQRRPAGRARPGGAPGRGEERERGRPGVERPAGQRDPHGRFGPRGPAGRWRVWSTSAVEPAVPMSIVRSRGVVRAPGRKVSVARADRRARDLGPAELGGGLDGLEVLGAQARLVAVGADLDDPERPAGQERERQGGPEDLAAALAARAVERDRLRVLAFAGRPAAGPVAARRRPIGPCPAWVAHRRRGRRRRAESASPSLAGSRGDKVRKTDADDWPGLIRSLGIFTSLGDSVRPDSEGRVKSEK